ncbi:hypothetical protein ABIC03_007967 [Bradyrhizobium sp. RT6a]|uniref:hypothetical protein n=1 Tax=Bradyrhizobium sp. RT6a TaxID=3156381 RepID=UPI0033973DF4
MIHLVIRTDRLHRVMSDGVRMGCNPSYLYATAIQRPYLRSICVSCRRSLQSHNFIPNIVRGGGKSGKGEKTLIEALGPPSNWIIPRTTKRRRKNRGMPPPATLDINTLPGSSDLTALEAAAVIRRHARRAGAVAADPNHALKWRYVDGRPLYPVDILSMRCALSVTS